MTGSVRTPKNITPGDYIVEFVYDTGAYQGVLTAKKTVKVQ